MPLDVRVIQGISGTLVVTGKQKRQELYSGVTDSSGLMTITFDTPFAATPNIQVQITSGNANHMYKIISLTEKGFQVHVGMRVTATVLTYEVVTSTITSVSGAGLDVLVTEK